MYHSHSDGFDFIGSNAAEAADAADPSNEADDCSCWGTAAGVSVVTLSGVVLVASEIKPPWYNHQKKIFHNITIFFSLFLVASSGLSHFLPFVWLAAEAGVVAGAGWVAMAGVALGTWRIGGIV